MRVTCLNSHRDHETRNLETKMLSESLVGKLCKGPTLRSWIRHIDEGLDDLQRESLLERSAKDRTESMRRYAPITEKTVN